MKKLKALLAVIQGSTIVLIWILGLIFLLVFTIFSIRYAWELGGTL